MVGTKALTMGGGNSKLSVWKNQKRGDTWSTSDKEAGRPWPQCCRTVREAVGEGQGHWVWPRKSLQCFHWNKVGGKKTAGLREENKGEEKRRKKGEEKAGEGRGRKEKGCVCAVGGTSPLQENG